MTYKSTDSMARQLATIVAAALLLSTLSAGISAAENNPDFTPDELARIKSFGPWPPPWSPDSGNRASGKASAVALGYQLFFETRLSANNRISCASCHLPENGFQDNRTTAQGIVEGVRNTPGLFNVRYQRWFGWDGANDSLWASSLRPILDPHEMGGSAERTANVLNSTPLLACQYTESFGKTPSARDPALLVNVAKAIAAWQETLVSPASPFDRFRTALENDDLPSATPYPAAARRGLRLFLGRGQCGTCHAGPLFTNGEFGDIGIPFFTKPQEVDPGRQKGIKDLLSSPFNLLGPYNDEVSRRNATGTRFLRPEHRNFGEFKVPTLRNLSLSAPYMHNGSLATLRDVVRHYSELDEDRLHADGERILKPLKLNPAEAEDLVAFLQSLSPDSASAAPVAPAFAPECVAAASRVTNKTPPEAQGPQAVQ